MRLATRLLPLFITCLPYTLSANEVSAPELPEAIQEIYPTVMNQQVWVAGGISTELPASTGKMTAKVHFWSPEYLSWQSAPSLPEGRHHTYLIAVEKRLFAFGGFVNAQGQWTNSRDVLMLDEGAKAWQKVASLPFALSETVGAVLNGKVHLAGGRSPSSEKNGQWQHSLDVSAHLVFDPKNLTHNNEKILEEGTPMTMTNLVVHVLSNGDHYNIETRETKVLPIDSPFV